MLHRPSQPDLVYSALSIEEHNSAYLLNFPSLSLLCSGRVFSDLTCPHLNFEAKSECVCLLMARFSSSKGLSVSAGGFMALETE